LCHNIPTFRKRFRENGWNIQLFRSIDSESIIGDNVYSVYPRIEQLYFETIKNSENFVYIENQYFCGSGYLWHDDQNKNLKNRIPMAILDKITEKIQNNEDYHAMIVLPLYPAGLNHF
jgi:phospholipase D1/2